jgi:hypothetical protein
MSTALNPPPACEERVASWLRRILDSRASEDRHPTPSYASSGSSEIGWPVSSAATSAAASREFSLAVRQQGAHFFSAASAKHDGAVTTATMPSFRLPAPTLEPAILPARTNFLGVQSSFPTATSLSRFAEPDLEDELVPPGNFSMVATHIYRSSFPKKKNFPFLKSLGLKSVLLVFWILLPTNNI